MKILLIDNYDSFTYNLKACIIKAGGEVDVFRNDKFDLGDMKKYHGVVLSPGPSLPKDAKQLFEIVEAAKGKPMLGVCLGMQAIAEVNGCKLDLAEEALHGFQTPISHTNHALFEGCESPFLAARYHSWIVREINQNIIPLGHDENSTLMALKVKKEPHFGFQFHPESILTPNGQLLIDNFLLFVKTFNNEKLLAKIA